MIFSYIVTQATLALLTRTVRSTDELLHFVDRYSHAMLVERDRCQPFTDEVTDLDELAVTFMAALMKRETIMHACALANAAYTLAVRGMALSTDYRKEWAKQTAADNS